MASIPAYDAQRRADAVGGRLTALFDRSSKGTGQVCPWELVVFDDLSAEARAAAAWIVADSVMKDRTGNQPAAYSLWRHAALSGTKLTGDDRAEVLAFAIPVFKAAGEEATNALIGYVGEWLWYLTTRELPPEADRTIEIINSPSGTVTDSGGDGIVVHRLTGAEGGFSFRLWEMKKFTADPAKSSDVGTTIRNAWRQLGASGAEYLAMMSFADKHLSKDSHAFVSTLVRQWVQAAPSSNAGVSVALDEAAVPHQAFHLSHTHFTSHRHDGAMAGLIIGIDELGDFSKDVRSYVWNAL
ncbi:hypothetical protein [Kitasatospora sp. NA04385]|uniref:hypothetical protein n=1 Tax=Kitasatospora sp. NA04385 TaxID=2742135 RepID=UPI0020CAA8B2|nr:hypothetical protein [Kitasatospora sp. NA04385]